CLGEEMRSSRKPKAAEPSLRDKLSEAFLKAFEGDFEVNGVEVIKQLRLKSPEKYAEIASRLIAATEPPKADDFASAKNPHELGFRLLKSVGAGDFDIDEHMIEAALAAQDIFIAALQDIRAKAEGAIQ